MPKTVASSPDLDTYTPHRGRSDSHVRFRNQATGFAAIASGAIGTTRRELQPRERSILEELGDEQRALSASLTSTDRIVDGVPRDPSAHAAAQSMRERLGDLGELRTALDAVYLDSTDPRMLEILGRDAALSEYMRGLYAWTKAVFRAFEELAAGLRVLHPDWAVLRQRLEDARAFYLDDLEGQIALDVGRLRMRWPSMGHERDPLSDLDAHLAELFWSAAFLARSLEKRFG